MSDLAKYLKLCKQSYYEGNPIISDSQFDELERLCTEDLGIGAAQGRTKHWYKMYSLQKYYIGENFPDWKNPITTPKLDGAACAIRYLDGKLHSVVTRGDGEYGQDITHLFSKVITKVTYDQLGWYKGHIPDRISTHKNPIQITGEFVAPKEIHNARNYAAGALNLKDIDEFNSRDVHFFAYDMQPYELEDYQDTLGTLHDYIGFYTIKEANATGIYPLDGSVIRVDSNKEYKRLGYTSKHPRGAYALKEHSEGVQSKLLDVIWQTGKSGKVTPVAILDPVNIDGAQVSRATLNNSGFIEALGIQIGDYVMVERAGGIIPRIIKKAESLDTEKLEKNSS